MELHQQVGRREAAALGLLAALAEGGTQVGRVRHGETRTIEEKDAMAVP